MFKLLDAPMTELTTWTLEEFADCIRFHTSLAKLLAQSVLNEGESAMECLQAAWPKSLRT